MKLYVMRHGPAEEQAESGVDGDRALTPAGRARVRSVAEMLSQLGEEPLLVVTSPLVRATQTAEIVALDSKLDARGGTVQVRRAMAPGGDGAALARALAGDGSKRVMFVGHEPDLSELVGKLLTTTATFGRAFDKAMVVGLHLPSGTGHAKLRFVLDPKSLKLSPDARSGP
jgi:phosphohistidine phosphatase